MPKMLTLSEADSDAGQFQNLHARKNARYSKYFKQMVDEDFDEEFNKIDADWVPARCVTGLFDCATCSKKTRRSCAEMY